MEKTSYHKIKKIAIIGAESVGKSTLCEALARHYHTVFVPEYARTYFEEHDIHNYTIHDLELIAKKQLELEQSAHAKANRYLFCDTTLITLKIWAQNQFNQIPEFILNAIPTVHYDLYLLCNNDIPWNSDEQRLHPHLRNQVFEWNKSELEQLQVNYNVVNGIHADRLESAIHSIDSFFIKKFI